MLTIEVDDQNIVTLLNELSRRATDLTPAMREISEIMMTGIEDAFEAEADPETGQKWEPISPLTVLRRGSSHPILQMSGQLAASIQPDAGKDFAVVSTSKVYAITHQLGAKQGQYGRTSRGGPIPWGDVPARPFLGLSNQTREDILEVLGRYLTQL